MRIKGNKSQEAKDLVQNSGLKLYWEEDVDKAA